MQRNKIYDSNGNDVTKKRKNQSRILKRRLEKLHVKISKDLKKKKK